MIEPRHIQQAIERTIEALALSTTKPGSRGGIRVSGGTNEPPMPIGEGIMWGKRLLHDRIRDWATMIADEQQIVITADPDDVSVLAWLHRKAHHIAAHDEAQQFIDEITEATKMIQNPYLPRAGKKYLGWHGGGDVYVRDGQSTVELADGTVERVETIRTWAAHHVLEWTGTAQEVSKAIKDYFGHDITPKQIKDAQYNDKRQGKDDGLVPAGLRGREYTYRIGSVLDRIKVKKSSKTT